MRGGPRPPRPRPRSTYSGTHAGLSSSNLDRCGEAAGIAAVSCARLRSSCTACASGLSTLCASGELARLGVDLDLLSFLDEQRHPDLESGLECGRLRHAAAGRVPARAWLGVLDRELDDRGQL